MKNCNYRNGLASQLKIRPLVMMLLMGASLPMMASLCQGVENEKLAAPKRRSRPQLPATFDKFTVQRLLDTIEESRNADILKLGYFYRRGTPVLPVKDGFELLTKSVNLEPVGTVRWFHLQMVRAWAATHCPELNYEEGFEVYKAIFDNSDKARQQPALYVLHKSIREFVFSVQEHRQPKLSDRTRGTLISAWTAYIPDIGLKSPAGPPPPWASVIKSLQLEDDFLPLVENALNNSSVPKSIELFRLAAILYRTTDLQKAIQFLEDAKVYLPKDDQAQTMAYYQLLVDWQSRSSSDKEGREIAPRFEKAIASQSEFIRLFGQGRAELAQLYVKADDYQGLSDLVQSLKSATADESEVITTGEILMQMYKSKNESRMKVAAQGRGLLETYLTMERTRDPEKELFSRSILAAAYMSLGELSKAKKILSPVQQVQIKQATTRSQQLHSQIAVQQEKLNQLSLFEVNPD